jgi:hypothetical protein
MRATDVIEYSFAILIVSRSNSDSSTAIASCGFAFLLRLKNRITEFMSCGVLRRLEGVEAYYLSCTIRNLPLGPPQRIRRDPERAALR